MDENKTIIIIQPGDTLSEIAKEHNMTVNEIKEMNNIEDVNLIIAGHELEVYKVEEQKSEEPPATTTSDTIEEMALEAEETLVEDLKEEDFTKEQTKEQTKEVEVLTYEKETTTTEEKNESKSDEKEENTTKNEESKEMETLIVEKEETTTKEEKTKEEESDTDTEQPDDKKIVTVTEEQTTDNTQKEENKKDDTVYNGKLYDYADPDFLQTMAMNDFVLNDGSVKKFDVKKEMKEAVMDSKQENAGEIYLINFTNMMSGLSKAEKKLNEKGYSISINCYSNGTHSQTSTVPTHYMGSKADIRFEYNGVRLTQGNIKQSNIEEIKEILQSCGLDMQWEFKDNGGGWGDVFLIDSLNCYGQQVNASKTWGANDAYNAGTKQHITIKR